MDDNNNKVPAGDNIRTLIYFFGLQIDSKLAEMRRNTPYMGVRSSDIRVFVAAAREPQSISEIARKLQITRQSVQSSVQRLQELGVVELGSLATNRRDKQVNLTTRGRLAGITAANQIAQVESAFEQAIGTQAWADFKSNLKKLVQACADGA